MAMIGKQLGALLELSPEPMFVLDRASLIVALNDAASELFGYARKDLIGKPVETLVPNHLLDLHSRGRDRIYAKPSRQALATGTRVCALHSSGREIPVEVTLGPQGSGEDFQLVCSVHDMSKRAAVEEHLRRGTEELHRRLLAADSEAHRAHEHFKLFLKHAPVGIALLDRLMRYLIVSDRYIQNYGIGNRDIHGLSHYEVFPDLPEHLREAHRRCLSGEVITQDECLFVQSDGSSDWFRWEMHPWRTGDGKVGGILHFSELITARKKAEDALLESYSDLEQRVADRTADLAALKDEADRANAQKSWFVAAASHDLRQPLQASLAYLTVLGRRAGRDDLEELSDKARMPLKAMSDILDVLLDISDLESGQVLPHHQDFLIDDLIARVVTNAQHQVAEKGLRLSYLPAEIAVRSDPKLLERVITNFVTNAIRYTDKGLIGIYCERAGDKVCLSITDTGIGIPHDAVEAIFHDHVQLGNPARDRRKGLGLGLSIAKRIADSLGHRISVTSELGSGSSFTIELPLAQSACQVTCVTAPADMPTATGCNPVVLLIDDDQDVSDAMQMLLQSYDFETYMANGPASAMAMLEAGLIPGLVLCDYRMPGTNGLDVIRNIRHQLNNNVASVLLTGDTGVQTIPEDIVNCALVHKPVDVDTFFAALATLEGMPALT
ncbi:MAG: PAS domain S-box protein [Rhizomicrobium sp.]|nr:PAS domain S-box protein [Rhizomicrobium sp.]